MRMMDGKLCARATQQVLNRARGNTRGADLQIRHVPPAVRMALLALDGQPATTSRAKLCRAARHHARQATLIVLGRPWRRIVLSRCKGRAVMVFFVRACNGPALKMRRVLDGPSQQTAAARRTGIGINRMSTRRSGGFTTTNEIPPGTTRLMRALSRSNCSSTTGARRAPVPRALRATLWPTIRLIAASG
jgi:hypothetical protein